MINLSTYKAPQDRGASRLREALWVLCKAVFFLAPLPMPAGLRSRLLRIFGAKLGNGVVIKYGVDISFPWRLEAGDHVWIGDGARILSLAPVVLGSHVCISQGAFLCTGSHDYSREDFSLITKPITIGDGVWVAANAFVGPGVRVGTGSVLAAGTVVVRDVPDRSFVAGNPSRILRNLD